MLPLSLWHVVLGFVDIATDVFGIVSTFGLASTTPNVCPSVAAGPLRANASSFFIGCAILQTIFLVGNLVSQGALAAATAWRNEEGGGRVALAFLRGVTNLELAYHEVKKRAGDGNNAAGAHATSASLHLKAMELLWEAPQAVVALSVLIVNIQIQLLRPEDNSVNVPDALKAFGLAQYATVVQALSAGFGLTSLALGALDFIRLHPMSFWALGTPPEKLSLGLVDVSSGTAWRSLVIGLSAVFSLLDHALMYTIIMHMWASSNALGLGNALVISPIWFVAVIVGMFIVCLLLLLQILLRGCSLNPGGQKKHPASPAATWMFASALFTFINVPWVTTAPVGSERFAKEWWSCWPSWVLAFLVSGLTIALAAIYGFVGADHPCTRAAGKGRLFSPRQFVSAAYDPVGMALLYVLPLTVASLDLVGFLGMMGWVTRKRRREERGKGRSPPPRPDKVPALAYQMNWTTLTMERIVENESDEQAAK